MYVQVSLCQVYVESTVSGVCRGMSSVSGVCRVKSTVSDVCRGMSTVSGICSILYCIRYM